MKPEAYKYRRYNHAILISYSARLPYLEHHKSTGRLVRRICNAAVLVLITGYREGFSDGFIGVWQCVRLAAIGQVLLTNLLVNAKNIDPHGLSHHR